MDKKYELLTDNPLEYKGRTLYHIRALKDFADVRAGEVGGQIESEKNLSQSGDCWLYSGTICDEAQVYDNAQITDSDVSDAAQIYGNAQVIGSSIMGKAIVHGEARAFYVQIGGQAEITGSAWVAHDFYDGKVTGTKYIYD